MTWATTMGYSEVEGTAGNYPSQKTSFDNYEVEHEFLTIGRRVMLLNARQIQRVLGKERISFWRLKISPSARNCKIPRCYGRTTAGILLFG